MGATTSLQKLTQLIQRYESDGGCVKRVEAETAELQTETEMSITLDVAVPVCTGDGSAAATPSAATVTGSGGLQVEFPSGALPSLDDYVSGETTVKTEAARVADDGTIVTTFIVGFGTASDAGPVSSRSAIPSTEDGTADDSAHGDGADASAATGTGASTSTETGASTATASAPVGAGDAAARPNGEDQGLTADGAESAADQMTELERKLAAARTEDLPPYEDTEYLQCLYDSLDTFTEMAEHIEMDVASETVRRYMTEAGVHEPSSYDTTDTEAGESTTDAGTTENRDTAAEAAGAVAESDSTEASTAAPDLEDEPVDPIENVSDKPLVADGSGLPDDVDVEELADALESCMTLHQIQRRLELSRDRTREVLNELNLIDLVMRRISHDPDREVSRAEIADRIRGSASDAR